MGRPAGRDREQSDETPRLPDSPEPNGVADMRRRYIDDWADLGAVLGIVAMFAIVVRWSCWVA